MSSVQLSNKQLSEEEKTLFEETVEQIKTCPKCRLSETRTHAVPGDGSWNAEIMFVGEGPGKNEDLNGLPFVGAAGKLLDQLLESIGLKREDVYITNIVKCWPPGNRDPKPDEVEACIPYLRTQTRLMKPKVICTLGRVAGKTIVKEDLVISRDHGKLFRKKGIVFMTLYHPAAALYNQSLKETLFNDFQILGEYLRKNPLNDPAGTEEVQELENSL
jgi:uracil-DNA glycosylase